MQMESSQKIFLIFFLLVVIMTQSRFTFGTRSNSYKRIIWFYLVRAEVVLWWHCLIFFVLRAPATSYGRKRANVTNRSALLIHDGRIEISIAYRKASQ